MIKKLDTPFFEKLLLQAEKSPRKRSHFNLHQTLDEPVQRLCIALKKGTYIRPHFHPQNNKWELMIILKGTVAELIFDATGKLLERLELTPNNSISGIELKPDTWHTVLPLTDNAVIMEIKEGPYLPSDPDDFATWSPEENQPEVAQFLRWAEKAGPGDYFNRADYV